MSIFFREKSAGKGNFRAERSNVIELYLEAVIIPANGEKRIDS